MCEALPETSACESTSNVICLSGTGSKTTSKTLCLKEVLTTLIAISSYTRWSKTIFFTKKPEHEIDEKVHHLINTGLNTSDVFQYDYDEVDVDNLTIIFIMRQINKLGATFLQLILSDTPNSDAILADKLIARYHVIIGQKILKQYTSINKQHSYHEFRLWQFRPDFFNSCSEYLVALRETLVKELSNNRFDQSSITEVDFENIKQFINKPCAFTISKLIGKLTTCNEKTKKLLLVNDPVVMEVDKLVERFDDVIIDKIDVKKVVEIKLLSMVIKLPLSFGNLDITFQDSEADPERKINLLVYKFINLLKIVT